jgi:cell wall-associated NlpC family hydrolase
MYIFKSWIVACLFLSVLSNANAQEQDEVGSQLPHPVVAQARELLGVPYRWGGTEPLKGFDCSGLIQYVFSRFQVSVPRMPIDMFKKYSPVLATQLLPGDVVFFNTFEKISHVGIYIGDRRFIHAPRKGLDVSIESMDSTYYKPRFAGARRLIPWQQSMLLN